MKNVAVLGLGNIGAGMARRLLQGGFTVTVYNRHEEVAEPFASLGACIAKTPAEAVSGSELVISIVSDDDASCKVWLGDHGALSDITAGTIVIESSTVSPAWIKELEARAAEKKCPMMDAPVTGTKTHANSGELLFLVGGAAAVLEKARPALRAMSRDIVHLGPVGAGARMKLINNFLCGAQVSALAEAIVLIDRVGLDRVQAMNILTSGAPGSPLVKAIVARISEKQYETQFAARLMEKDLTYAARMAEDAGLSLKNAESAAKVFHNAVLSGFGDKDIASVVEPLLEQRPSRNSTGGN